MECYDLTVLISLDCQVELLHMALPCVLDIEARGSKREHLSRELAISKSFKRTRQKLHDFL